MEGAVITLINAVYFKGLWVYPFPENGPRLTFYAGRKQVEASYMEQNGQFYYDDSVILNAQLLRLPYRGGKFAMYVILPHQDSSINDVLSRINQESLHKALWYMSETEVNVTMPKFRFDYSERLNQPLQDVGLDKFLYPSASLILFSVLRLAFRRFSLKMRPCHYWPVERVPAIRLEYPEYSRKRAFP